MDLTTLDNEADFDSISGREIPFSDERSARSPALQVVAPLSPAHVLCDAHRAPAPTHGRCRLALSILTCRHAAPSGGHAVFSLMD